jgi:hypothetical protein
LYMIHCFIGSIWKTIANIIDHGPTLVSITSKKPIYYRTVFVSAYFKSIVISVTSYYSSKMLSAHYQISGSLLDQRSNLATKVWTGTNKWRILFTGYFDFYKMLVHITTR